ncbi:CDP-glycerol glycerophosphotransferase family protein [Nocardioides sp. J54]|uniref:CDP-glycerol glycerophosphotransferase family protein n=1 Tax=Nocardioides sp. J54 TaxID=935866 RepID=UPI0018DEAD73|nr:CDP-glycerol glycerophosphotransferase family protein [Nocardioides sp. J54]
MAELRRLILLVATLPLVLLRPLVPVDRSLWIFGAWFGEKYADNSRHLFEHVVRHCPEVTPVWFSARRDVREAAVASGGLAAHPWSIRGLLWSLRAGCGIVSNSERDLNPYLQPRHVLNLWHGFPLKRIRLDNPHENRRARLKGILHRLLPHSAWRMDLGVASLGDEHAELMASAFGVDRDAVRTDGYPRNDALLGSTEGRTGSITRVAYLPTFRDRSSFSPTTSLSEALADGLDGALGELGIELIVRPHPVDRGRLPDGLQNVRSDESSTDVHDFLRDVDILITDYSSIYVDFLLTGRPIVFAPFDLDSYLGCDRPMYFRYEEVTPGPRCSDWSEVLSALGRFVDDPDWCRAERVQARERWHLHDDDRSCARTVAYLRDRLNV